MKRITAILLVLSMVLSLSLLLTACDKSNDGKDTQNAQDSEMESETESETEVETLGDPVADPSVMSNVYENTLSAFLPEGMASTSAAFWRKVLNRGSLNVVYSDNLRSDPISINETLLWDTKAMKLVSQTNLSMDEKKDMSFTMWADRNGLTASGESLFGSKDAYTLTMDNLIGKFPDSALADYLEVSADDMNYLVQMMDALRKQLDKLNPAKAEELSKEIFEKMMALTRATSKTETVTAADGKTQTEYVVVTYTIDNNAIKGYLDFASEYMITISSVGTVKPTDPQEMIDQIKAELDETVQVHIVEKDYIRKDTRTLEKVEVTLDITPLQTEDAPETSFIGDDPIRAHDEESSSESITGTFTATFSDQAVNMSLDSSIEGKTVKGSLSLKRQVTGSTTTYTVQLNGGSGNLSADLLAATLSYNQSNGELSLNGDYMEDENKRTAFGATAIIKLTEHELFAKLTKLTEGEDIIEIKDGNELSVTIKAVQALPATPAETKNLVTMNESDLDQFFEVMYQAPLGKNALRTIDDLFGSAITDNFAFREVSVEGTTIVIPVEYAAIDAAAHGVTAAYAHEDMRLLINKIPSESSAVAGLSRREYERQLMAKAEANGATDILPCYIDLSNASAFMSSYSDRACVCFLIQTEDAFWIVEYTKTSSPNWFNFQDLIRAVVKSDFSKPVEEIVWEIDTLPPSSDILVPVFPSVGN